MLHRNARTLLLAATAGVAAAAAAPAEAGEPEQRPTPAFLAGNRPAAQPADRPATWPADRAVEPPAATAASQDAGATTAASQTPGAATAASQAPDGATPADAPGELAELRRRIERQAAEIELLRQSLAAQQRQLQAMQRQLPLAALESQRGTGGPERGAELIAQATGQPQPPAASPGQQQQPAQQPAPQPAQPVGQAPERSSAPPPVAQVFDQPGVLTPRGKFVLEPSVAYSYSSTSRLSVVGYTVIPAINIGLFDVREVKRNTWTGTLTARYGLTNRLEIEGRLPYVRRSDDTISRPFGEGGGNDQLFSATGTDIGDIELAARYQLNQPPAGSAYYIGSLRFKTRTGKDPFEVLTDPSAINSPASAGTPGLQRELPTGSGFYALQPALTWLFPSDPVVFFGSVSYLYNFARDNVSSNTTNGPQLLGKIKPGDIFGFNFGLGLSLNDRASLSIGYDHASVGRTEQNGSPVPLSVRTQLGTLLVGYSYRLDAKRSLNLSLGVGATRDAPDLTLTLRMPYSF